MITYYNKITENGYIYSVDNIRANFVVNRDEEYSLKNFIEDVSFSHIEAYPQNFKMGQFRYLYTFRYDSNSSMTIGFGLNGKSSDSAVDSYKGYIDFNPNKLGYNELFRSDYMFIKQFFRHFDIIRIDLAVDMPYKRENLILLKDKRKYKLERKSLSDTTEYLGPRSSVGFVKLYNKTLESKLDYDLTRLELTIEPSLESYMKSFPEVYNIGIDSQVGLSFDSLTDTEKYILRTEWLLLKNGLDGGLSYFKSLGRKMKDKLMPFLLPDESKINVSKQAVDNVIKNALLEF